jgi:hypothetical protein
MSTYAQIRQNVLLMLDVMPSMTGDIKDMVDLTMRNVVLEIVTELWPDELLTTSSTLRITSATTTPIPIGATGFAITDFLKLSCLLVNEDPTNTGSEAVRYKYYSPEAWYRLMDRYAGNSRNTKSFTMHDSKIELKDYPTGSTVFDLVLKYYKAPAAVADAGIPEIPVQHHSLIEYSTVMKFPHLFSGDRQALFMQYATEYKNARKRMLQDLDSTVSDLSIAPNAATAVSANRRMFTFWGGRQTS